MNSSKKCSYSIQHVGLNFREATSATAEKNKHGLKMSRKVSKLIAYKDSTRQQPSKRCSGRVNLSAWAKHFFGVVPGDERVFFSKGQRKISLLVEVIGNGLVPHPRAEGSKRRNLF